MTKVVSSYGPTQRVNILKKIKVDGAWNFYPAVVESNGKLKDKVRIKGAVEVHPEGTYYLEWREGKSRSREPVPDKADVLDWARRKFLELQAAKAGVLIAETPEQASLGITLADAAADFVVHAGDAEHHAQVAALGEKRRFVPEAIQVDVVAKCGGFLPRLDDFIQTQHQSTSTRGALCLAAS